MMGDGKDKRGISGADRAGSREPERSLSEPELLQRLQFKYAPPPHGNSPSHVLVPHVKSGAGFYRGNAGTGTMTEHRTIDAYLMAITLGGKLELTAFELKSSRSDWLRELKCPAKAAAFTDKVDKFVLVTGAKDICRDGELPEGWGLMVPSGDGLRVKHRAKSLYDRPTHRTGFDERREEPDYSLPEGFDRSFLAALLRQTAKANETSRESGASNPAVSPTRKETK